MGRAFAIAIVLNLGFVVVEFFYGYLANSTALMADAGHNLSDVMGLMLAWGAVILARRQPSARYTYGLRGTSMLAALSLDAVYSPSAVLNSGSSRSIGSMSTSVGGSAEAFR